MFPLSNRIKSSCSLKKAEVGVFEDVLPGLELSDVVVFWGVTGCVVFVGVLSGWASVVVFLGNSAGGCSFSGTVVVVFVYTGSWGLVTTGIVDY